VNYPNRGKDATVLILPTVAAQAQTIFGCSTAEGVELEDYGGSGSAGSHWEMKIVKEDYMVSVLPWNPVTSGLTLALFQDSGWYTVNWNYAQPLIWGLNQGCAWLTDKCITSGIPQQGMCTNKAYVGCDVYNMAQAYCDMSNWSSLQSQYQYFSDQTLAGGSGFPDFCPVLTGYSNGDCRDTATTAYDYFGEVTGPGSRCMTSTLLRTAYVFTGELHSVCHKVKSCESDHAVLEIGGVTVNCPFTGGDVTVTGFNGVLKCPNSNVLCSAMPCKSACYGQGICKAGVCMCDPGYGASDCSITCAANCKACDSATTCKACYSTATLVQGVCTCPSGSTWDSTLKICQVGSIIGCDVSCKGCATTTTCADCYSTATLSDGVCTCPQYFHFNPQTTECETYPCPSECNGCDGTVGCTVCYDGQSLVNGHCYCPSGSGWNPNTKLCDTSVITGCPAICNGCATTTTCSACYSTATLTADNICVCPDGAVFQAGTKTCVFTSCPSSCNGCATATTCSACYSTASLTDGQCVCPTGTNFDASSLSCKSTVITGCDNLCNECASTTVCKTCHSNALLTSAGKCLCPSGSAFDISTKSCIIGCTSGCKTCSGISDYRCLSCNTGYYLLSATCVKACPTGYNSTTTGCVLSNPSIYKAVFQQWNNTYYSSDSPVPLFFGTTSAFLPSPDTDDPILAYARGLYYTGVSKSLLPPNYKLSNRVSLAPSHTVEMWIRPDDSSTYQNLLHKYADESLVELSIVNTKLRLVLTAYNITSLAWVSTMTDGTTINSKQWQWVTYTLTYDQNSQNSIINLYVNSAKENKVYSGLIFLDLDAALYAESFSVGSKYSTSGYTSGYKGFLAMLNIYNQAYTPSYSGNLCIGNFCLAECDFYQYVDTSGSCGSCLTSCSFSCCQANSCVLNIDPKCTSPLSFTTCSACVSGANLEGGKCNCMKNSYFEITTMACVCNSGYTLTNGYCATCGNYLASNEAKAYFSEDYKRVVINFARFIKSGITSTCSELFYQSTLVKLGKNPTCVWQSNTELQVYLGNKWNLTNEAIEINPLVVQANGTECTLNIQDLKPIVQYFYAKPTPTAVITAPNTYSFGCNKNDLKISGDSSIGSNLQYAWSLSSSPSNSALTKYVASITDQKFKIPVTMLTVSVITISLTVTNQLSQTNTASFAITVKNEYALEVTIDGGSSSSITASQGIQYKALVNTICGNSTYLNIQWKYVSSSLDTTTSVFDSSPVLSNSKCMYILKVKENQLKAGNWFVYNATATDGYASGWSALNITVKHSDLVLKLNRADGTVSNDTDLYISASDSYDPDDSSTSLSYNWTCAQNNAQCLDSSGSNLIGEELKSTLTVLKSKLKVGSEYVFTITISKDTRTASKSITIKVTQPTGSSLSISFSPFKVNHQYGLIIIALVSTLKQPGFLWAQSSGPTLSSLSELTKSFIKFAANSMQEGTSYSYSLTMTFSSTLSLVASIPWITNKGPTCDGIDISQNTDLTYTLSGLNCVDGDDQDYPLYYQFGVIMNKVQYYLNTPCTGSTFTLGVPSGTWQLTMRVCDSMWTCSTYSKSITATSRRLLSDVALEDQYRASILNQDMIPSSIIMYSTYTLNNPTLSYMFTDLNTFITSQDPIDEGILDTCLACLSSMTSQSSVMTQDFLTQTFKILNETLMGYTDEITDSQTQSIIDTISPYYKNITDISLLLNLFQYIANSWMNNTLPGDAKEYSNGIHFSNTRKSGEDLLNTTYKAGNQTTTILPNATLTNETIYDFSVTIYPNAGNYSDIIDISTYKSGSYQNYNLDIVPPSSEPLSSSSSLITINTSFTQNPGENWDCYMLNNGNWETGKCSIISIVNNTATISAKSTGSLQLAKSAKIIQPVVEEDSDSAGTENAPSIAMGSIVFLAILLSLIFLVFDRKNIKENLDLSILKNHLTLSLLIPQKSFTRVINVIHLATVLLLELAIVGAMYDRDNPTSGNHGSFSYHASNYSAEDLINMVVGLLLGQFVSALLLGLSFGILRSTLFKAIFLIICGILISLSIASIVVMTVDYSAETSTYWIIGFIIVLPFDFFVFQSIFAVIKYFVTSEKMPLQSPDGFATDSQVMKCAPALDASDIFEHVPIDNS